MNPVVFSQVLLFLLFAIFQGIAFGLMPAFSSLLTNPSFHSLSSTEFHTLFIPFLMAAILFATLAGWLSHRGKLYRVFLGGVLSNILYLLLLALTTLSLDDHEVTLPILYGAMFFLGLGSGALLMALTRWMSALFPKRPSVSILALWASASFGMTLSESVVEYALLLHLWWIAPALILGSMGVLLFIIDIFENYPPVEPERKNSIPLGMLLFLGAAFLYGFIDSVVGVWRGGFLFTAFWAAITLGRLFVALCLPFVSYKIFYFLLPILQTLTLYLFQDSSLRGYGCMALAGGALFPLNVSMAQMHYPMQPSLVTGWALSAYLVGIGFGGVGFSTPWMLIAGGILMATLHTITLLTDPNKRQKKANHKETQS